MIVTIFRSRLRPDAGDYAAVAAQMLELAGAMPGFVSFKSFQHADGERCSVVEFADWESHNAWAKHPRHVAAQQQGRHEFYAAFSLTVAEVQRAYSFQHEEA